MQCHPTSTLEDELTLPGNPGQSDDSTLKIVNATANIIAYVTQTTIYELMLAKSPKNTDFKGK